MSRETLVRLVQIVAEWGPPLVMAVRWLLRRFCRNDRRC